MRKKIIAGSFACLTVIGCSDIPKNAAVLSNEVSIGITRLQEENERIIHALADIERAYLEQNWGQLYGDIELFYRSQHSIDATTMLNQDDRRKIAELSEKIKNEILGEIASLETSLIMASRNNAQHVITVNNEVQNYLLAVKPLERSKETISSTIGQIGPIDYSKIQGVVKTRLASISSSIN